MHTVVVYWPEHLWKIKQQGRISCVETWSRSRQWEGSSAALHMALSHGGMISAPAHQCFAAHLLHFRANYTLSSCWAYFLHTADIILGIEACLTHTVWSLLSCSKGQAWGQAWGTARGTDKGDRQGDRQPLHGPVFHWVIWANLSKERPAKVSSSML